MNSPSSMTDSEIFIPGYSIHGRLGKGGMAEVYLATQQSLQRKVAIKVLSAGTDPALCIRFIQEGHIVASLHHPSIVTIYDINRLDDGRHYMAMEYLPGGDLSAHKGEVFAPQRALKIVQQIASALAVVHEKGLVHRDIKPANILFRTPDTAVLTDFGIAKEVQLDSDMTQCGVAVGSPAYSSPEQTQCQRLDARSDIYSLGVILLEMLTGKNPYRGANYPLTVLNHLQMPMPVLPDSLAMFQAVLERMLAKDPAQRFAGCAELLKALGQIELHDLDATQLLPAVPLKAASPAPVRPARSPQRRRWLLPATTALVALLTLLASGLYLRQQWQLAEWLALGEQRLAEGRWIEPAADSAEHYFNAVLAQRPQHAEALSGLRRLRDARVAAALLLGEQRLSEGQLIEPAGDSARDHFQLALNLDSDSAAAATGLQRVQQARIQAWLDLFNQRLASGHWQTPADDSAEFYLQLAQTLDASDAQVLAAAAALQQARINALLEQARASLADKRLLLPEDDSAVYYYRQVLLLQADQADALAGLERVAQMYRELAQAAYARGDFPAALAMIERGLQVQPEHGELRRLKREHQGLLNAARAARNERSQRVEPVAVAPASEPAEPQATAPNPVKRLWNSLFGN